MRFPGILPAVTTPFDADDRVDVNALKGNVEALLEAGVHGFVATGTMGEAAGLSAGGHALGPTGRMGEAAGLSAEERRTVVRAVVEAADRRVPVIAGVSSGS